MGTWRDVVVPTHLENWPKQLRALSIPQVDIPISIEEAVALGSNIVEWGPSFAMTPEEREQEAAALRSSMAAVSARMAGLPVPDVIKPPPVVDRRRDISGIRSRVSDALRGFPGGAFVRLGSRSPKDAWLGHRTGFRCCADDGKDPLRFILDCSERMYEDLSTAIAENYEPHIFVRRWMEFDPQWEFRCFMRDRELVGISQYNYREHCRFLDEKSIRNRIEDFFPGFRDACHLDSVVFDVVIIPPVGGVHTVLLEINPWFGWTDPCLFSWKDGGDFDGTLRLAPPNQERELTLDEALADLADGADE